MPDTILPGTSFTENLQQLPTVEGLQRIDLVDEAESVVASIENKPGKQGSLAVYQYLKATFGALNATAAQHGLEVFAEHVKEARAHPGAHPNIDRLIEIAEGGSPLRIEVIVSD